MDFFHSPLMQHIAHHFGLVAAGSALHGFEHRVGFGCDLGAQVDQGEAHGLHLLFGGGLRCPIRDGAPCAHQRCDHAVLQAGRQLVGPLRYGLGIDADGLGCAGDAAAKKFDGLSFLHARMLARLPQRLQQVLAHLFFIYVSYLT